MKHSIFLILVLLASLVPGSVLASAPALPLAVDRVVKTACTYALGYATIDDLKADLLAQAKRLAVSELFGELITASTAVENFVVTNDQIRTSSMGFVRIEGDAEYRNGNDLAQVCVTIVAYVTDEDRAQFEPVTLEKRHCVSDAKLSAAALQDFAREEVLAQMLVDYDSKLKDAERESVLRLIQRVKYLDSGFVAETDTFCVTAEGTVVPIEILAFLTPFEEATPAKSSTTAAKGTAATQASSASGASTTSALGEVVAIDAVESEHPYPNGGEQSWYINNSSGASAMQLHFSRIELEPGVDSIQITDPDGGLLQEIWESYPDGLWTEILPGVGVYVRLISDSADQAWGLGIDAMSPVEYTTVARSAHPYPNNYNEAVLLLNNDANPEGTRVQFDRIELEDGVDYIVIEDTDGTPYQWITGSYPDGFTSNGVPGSAIQVRLVTDGSGRMWGYNVAAVATGVPDGAENRPTNSALTDSDHPHCKNCEKIWTITNPDPTALSSKIHFDRLELANRNVSLEILDANDTVIQTFLSESLASNFWSDYIPGRVVKLRFKNTYDRQGWGFRVDKIVTSVHNPGIAQSDHPHCRNCEKTWTITNPDPNAVSSKIHFDWIALANRNVSLEILDANDTVIQTFLSESLASNFWSDYIPGRVVKLKFKNTYDRQGWGFRVDAIASQE